MLKAILLIAIILQIVVAVVSDGLGRALAELCAFMLAVGFIAVVRKERKALKQTLER